MSLTAYAQNGSLVPNDLQLVIPGNIPFLEVLIVIAFILHIIFVNIIVAGAANAIYLEWKGIIKKNPIFDRLSLAIATHVSIHKSIAVVLGVGPLLIISTIYTQFFYPSTILIGKMWLMLIPMLIIAFLLLYTYKFTWNIWQNHKVIHLLFGLLGTAILFFVPLVFITNTASMLHPAMWDQSRSFFQALFDYPTIWQRYLHFMAASFGAMGIYMYWWGKRKLRKEQDSVYEEAAIFGKKSAAFFTVIQLLAGPFLLVSMNDRVTDMFLGGSPFHTMLLLTAVGLAVILIVLLIKLVQKESKGTFIAVATVFLLIMGNMGWIRHEVRELYLEPYMKETPRTVAIPPTTSMPVYVSERENEENM